MGFSCEFTVRRVLRFWGFGVLRFCQDSFGQEKGFLWILRFRCGFLGLRG